jgi:hypothetical protein
MPRSASQVNANKINPRMLAMSLTVDPPSPGPTLYPHSRAINQ